MPGRVEHVSSCSLFVCLRTSATDLTVPGRYSTWGSTGFPVSFTPFSILNAARTEAIVIHIVDNAKSFPAQALQDDGIGQDGVVTTMSDRNAVKWLAHLRPNPKAMLAGSTTALFKRPSGWRNRSGLNAVGSGKSSSSCKIALYPILVLSPGPYSMQQPYAPYVPYNNRASRDAVTLIIVVLTRKVR